MNWSQLAPQDGAPRRVVLIDFDWQDADLMSELLRRPGISVLLVAGQGPDDPGVRVAELCDVPHTTDLADLTRAIFDLALVGDRSPRRPRLESLLKALGTSLESPQSFLTLPHIVERQASASGGGAPATSVTAWNDDPIEAMVDHALPDLSAPIEPAGRHRPSPDGPAAPLEAPGPEDRLGLEHMLGHLTRVTGALAAELHELRDRWDQLERRASGLPVKPDGRHRAWLEVAEFRVRVELAVERHRREGIRFAIHRLRFEGSSGCVEALCRRLSARLRPTDSLCRTRGEELLLLCVGPPDAFGPIRHRVVSLFEDCCREAGVAAPAIADERIELDAPEREEEFLSAASGWLASG